MRCFAFIGISACVLVTASPAAGADLPRPALKAPTVAALDPWTGFYAGVHVGWAWWKKDWYVFLNDANTQHDFDGFFGGGQFGFNWVHGTWLIGVEADASWTDASGQSICPQITFACRTEVDWLATLTARVGYVMGPSLYYLKAGGTWAGETFTHVPLVAGGPLVGKQTRSGWIIGAGFERAVGNGWSWKIEYDYLDFGDKNVSASGVVANIDQFAHRVIVGANYRFASGR